MSHTDNLHSLLQEFIQKYCTSSNHESTKEEEEEENHEKENTKEQESSSSSLYASFQSHTPEQQRVQFQFKLHSFVSNQNNSYTTKKYQDDMEQREVFMKHNVRFTSMLAFIHQIVLPPVKDDQEAEVAIHSILYSFLYDKFHTVEHSADSLETIFWNRLTQGLQKYNDDEWLEQLKGLQQLCSLPEILYMAFDNDDDDDNVSLQRKKRKVSSSDENHPYNHPMSYSMQQQQQTQVWKRVYAMLGYILSHILLSNTFDGISYHEFIESISTITSDDTIGFFDWKDRGGLYVSSEYSSFMTGVYGYILDCMALSTNVYMGHGILECVIHDDSTEQERLCQCYSLQMKIELEFVIESWCQDGIFNRWMEIAKHDKVPNRCFVMDIASTLLMYCRYHLPQSEIYMACHRIIDFIDKLTSPESIESYVARVDSWQASLAQNTNRRKRKAFKQPSYPFQPFLMYLQVLLTIPSPSKALSLLHTLRNFENISISDHQKAWFCLFDYYHQNDLLLVSHPHHDSKPLPFHNEMVSSTVGHFFLDYLYSLMSTVTEEVEQVIQRENRNMSYEEECWLNYNQIRIRNTVLLYTSVRPALGKPLQLATLVAPSLDGNDFMEMNTPFASMSDERKIWILLKENYDVVERPKSLDSELILDNVKDTKHTEPIETKGTAKNQALEMDSRGVDDAILSEQEARDDESQDVVILNDSDDESSVHSDLEGEDLDSGKGDENIVEDDLYVSGSEPEEEDTVAIQEDVLEVGGDGYDDEIEEEIEEEEEDANIAAVQESPLEECDDVEEEEDDGEEESKQTHEEESNDEEQKVNVDASGILINAEDIGISSDDYVASQDDAKYTDVEDASQTDSNNSFGEWQEDYPDEEDEEVSHESGVPINATEESSGGHEDNYVDKEASIERPLDSSSGSTLEKDVHIRRSIDDHTFNSGTFSERMPTKDVDHDSAQSSDDMAEADDTTVEYSVSERAPTYLGQIDYSYDAEASVNDVNESDYTRNEESTQAEQSALNTQEHEKQTNIFSHEDIDEGNDADIEITENEDDGIKHDESSMSGANIEANTEENAKTHKNGSSIDTVGPEIPHEHTNLSMDKQDFAIPQADEIAEVNDSDMDDKQGIASSDMQNNLQQQRPEREEENEAVTMTNMLQADSHNETGAEAGSQDDATASSEKSGLTSLEDDYSTMSYRELQAECKSRGLSATGKKEDLRSRLNQQVGTALEEVVEAVDLDAEQNVDSELQQEKEKEPEEQQQEEDRVDMAAELQADGHDVTKDEQPDNSQDDYSTMSYRELQAECKSRGLSATGRKEDLRSRLTAGKIGLPSVKEKKLSGNRKSIESEMEEIILAAKESAKVETDSRKESNKRKASPSLDSPHGSRFSSLIAKGIDLLTPKPKPNEVIEIDDSSVDSLPKSISVKDAPDSAVSKLSNYSVDPVKRMKSESKTLDQYEIETSKVPAKKKAKSSSPESYRKKSTTRKRK